MKNFGRNFIIAFLMVLTIYQTGELWFGNFSDHNFFSLFNNSETTYSKNVAYTLNRLIVNLGDNKVICRGSDIYGSEYKTLFDKSVSNALLKGVVTENTGDIDWSNILDNRAIIYEYSCTFEGSDLSGIFNVKSDNCSKVKTYNTIIISPRADNSFMRVVFYDSEKNTSTTIDLKSDSIIGQCYETSSEFVNNDDGIYYISSVENGFNIFNGNKFLPQSKSEIYSYSAIEPHLTLTDMSMIEKNANIFFDNAAAKNYTKNDGTYAFSDESSVVKFYNNNVLEYFNYSTKSKNDSSFTANYVAAINIIKRDSFITNEFYLDRYILNDGQYVFYFNYKINDLTLVPGENIKELTGMNSMIEVTVSEGSVDKYKKYACRYTISDKTVFNTKVDFVSAVDEIYATLYKGANNAEKVDDITLAYIAETKTFGLNWIVDINNEKYVVSTDRQV